MTSVAFSPNGQRIISGSQDSTARLRDAAQGTELVVFQGHSGIVTAARFSPDGNAVLTADRIGFARIWNLRRFLDTVPSPKPN